jgi:hypothetical protein
MLLVTLLVIVEALWIAALALGVTWLLHRA